MSWERRPLFPRFSPVEREQLGHIEAMYDSRRAVVRPVEIMAACAFDHRLILSHENILHEVKHRMARTIADEIVQSDLLRYDVVHNIERHQYEARMALYVIPPPKKE